MSRSAGGRKGEVELTAKTEVAEENSNAAGDGESPARPPTIVDRGKIFGN